MALEIKDLVSEGRTGNIDAVGGLTKNETIGLLAAMKKTVNQTPDTVSTTLGSYGLSLSNLQDTGIVKKGIAGTGSLSTVLADPSVFTGKKSVNSLSDLTSNEAVQKEIMQDVLQKNSVTLKQQGTITGTETSAILAGLITTGTPLSGSPDAAFGVTLASTKASSLLTKVVGIGGGATSAVKSAVDTVKTAIVDQGVDAFIGSNKVPKVSKTVTTDTAKATKTLGSGDLF